MDWRYEFGKRWERFLIWIAWHMPRELVRWCAIRVGAHASTGIYGTQEPDKLLFIKAVERWDS